MPRTRQIPQLDLLLRQVEKTYGRKIATTTDFESLSVVIEHDTSELLSAATLKRLWGYVVDSRTPRTSTLDILSRFIGKKDFKQFLSDIGTDYGIDSQFFSAKILLASDIPAGGAVAIGWGPDRLVELEHLGDGKFRVLDSQNAKLHKGDEFEADSFILGAPLYVASILRADGSTTLPYVAGQTGGLTVVQMLQ